MSAATPQEAVTWWNLPNQLTLSRFGMAVLLFVLISYQFWACCLIVFVVAAITDWLDGYLARRWKMGTALGRNLDPLADKVLNCGAFIFLLPLGQAGGWLLPWMVAVIVLRELIITSLRSFMETAGSKFGADWLGKIKMVLQCAALVAIFILLTPHEPSPTWTAVYWLTVVLVYGTVITTLLSGVQYLWRAVTLFGTAPGT
ncbi:MAG TPA: CDP-diacylglycerol--glycerol-3-phosphate 3-phosphatidyltransferase [Planctomycetales bacterium]|jgi:CDP-diacylglycerol--glycerol-3-phosphate 3-phosphatidyltransferase|nr:CDP-diacylglycerol--glycerol-3-phosphate 3-phosphatidyltransferase [Planctomycetales bacterium]